MEAGGLDRRPGEWEAWEPGGCGGSGGAGGQCELKAKGGPRAVGAERRGDPWEPVRQPGPELRPH